MLLTYESIAKRIDHALLTPTMTEREMLHGCQLAAAYEVASVCIKPHAVEMAVRALAQSSVKIGTVIGFPHGGQTTRNKVAETCEALANGATEIDMVVNVGEVIGGNWSYVENEIRQVAGEVRSGRSILKVILETCYLDDQQKIRTCEICGQLPVDYVKTSTGFGTAGATSADLILMKRHTPKEIKLKASGGIRNLKTALEFTEIGAERLGLSRTAEILDELCVQLGLPARSVSRGTKSSKQIDENY